MIAKHSFEETHSGDGEGIEFVVNEPCEDEEHGRGQYTEKRAYLHRYSSYSFIYDRLCSTILCIRARV